MARLDKGQDPAKAFDLAKIHRLLRQLRTKCTALQKVLNEPSSALASTSLNRLRAQDLATSPIFTSKRKVTVKYGCERVAVKPAYTATDSVSIKICGVREAVRNVLEVCYPRNLDVEEGRASAPVPSLVAIAARAVGLLIESSVVGSMSVARLQDDAAPEFGSAEDEDGDGGTGMIESWYEEVSPAYRR